MRGSGVEVLSLVGGLSLFVAQWFAADMAELRPMGESAGSLRYAAGFVVVFVASVFVCGFFAWLGKKLVDAIGLRPADRTLGAAFGVLRGMVLLLAVAVVVGLTPLQEALWWQESQAAPVLSEMLRGLSRRCRKNLEGICLPDIETAVVQSCCRVVAAGCSRKRMEYNYVWNRRRRQSSARQSADL